MSLLVCTGESILVPAISRGVYYSLVGVSNQNYKLEAPDLLPNFLTSLKDLKIKVRYKQNLNKRRIIQL